MAPSLTDAVAQDVEAEAHLEPIPAGVERQRKDGGILSIFSISHPLAELGYLPDHVSIIAAVLNQ